LEGRKLQADELGLDQGLRWISGGKRRAGKLQLARRFGPQSIRYTVQLGHGSDVESELLISVQTELHNSLYCNISS